MDKDDTGAPYDARQAPRVTRDADPAQLTSLVSSAAIGQSTRQWNIGRDGAAIVLLLAATLLPWNLYFGVGVPGSSVVFFAVLIAVTLLSVGSVVATYAGESRLRTKLSAPYAMFVVAVVVFDVVQTVRYGGSPAVAPPGVGPGAWVGIAGAVLAGQPVITGTPQSDIDRRRPWLVGARLVGIASIVLAALSVGFYLYWQTNQVLPGMSQVAFGHVSAMLIGQAVVYDAVALAPVIVGSGWILRRNKGSRLATIMLGISTLAAGVAVWTSHVGRQIDAFHGVAQTTSSGAVGFEGYLVWAIAAAIFAPLTLRAVLTQRPLDADVWGQAIRKSLFLAAIWCVGTAAMRIVDLVVNMTFQLDRPIFDGAVLIAVNLVTAALALWLRRNLDGRPTTGFLLAGAILLALIISRVVAGISLAPRNVGPGALAAQELPVYGNALALQMTCTFDIVLCFLAVGIAAMAVAITRTSAPSAASDVFAAVVAASQQPSESSKIPVVDDNSRPKAAAVTQAARGTTGASSAESSDTSQVPALADDAAGRKAAPTKQSVDAVLHASTQRFGAGTTYTGRNASTADDSDK